MQQSDYPLSLIPEVRRKRKPLYPERPVNFAREKTKMALWFESHCNASSGRDKYVKELQKYITVDVIGKFIKLFTNLADLSTSAQGRSDSSM